MPFPFTCPSCRHTSQVPDGLAGTRARCPTCSMVVDIPARTPFRAEAPVPPPLPKLEPPIDDDRLASRSSEIRMHAPTPAKKKGGMAVAIIGLVVVGFFALFCCGGLGLASYFAFSRSHSTAMAFGTTMSGGGSKTTRFESPRPTKPAPTIDESKLPLSHWIALLRDGTAADAGKARTRLLAAGSLAVPELRQALADDSPKLRLAAASLLGELRDLAYEAVGDLAKRLDDLEPSVRETSAIALGQIGRPSRAAYADLVRASADTNLRVRAAALDTLKQFGPPDQNDVPKLLPLMTVKDAEQKLANAKAIEDLKPDPDIRLALFTPSLRDTHLSMRLFAIRAVSSAGPMQRSKVLALVFPLLEDKESDVRSASLAAIKALGPATEGDLNVLQPGVASSYPEVRQFCIESIAGLGPKAEPALPFLARALRDSNPETRIAASAAMASIGRPAREYLQDLLLAQADRQPEVRRNIMTALGAIGREPKVVETLFLAMSDTQVDVRNAACDGLKRLQPPLGADDLLTLYPLLTSPHVEVRRFCAAQLARIGKDSEPVLVKIQEALGDPDHEVRASLYAALGAIGPKAHASAPKLLDAMRDALRDPAKPGQAQVFRQAALTLSQVGESAQAMPLLRTALQDKNSPLLKDVLTVLATVGPEGKSAAPELLKLLDKPAVRKPVAQALAKVGKPILDDLLKILDRGNREEKLGALLTIELMGSAAKTAYIDVRKVATTDRDREVIEAASRTLKAINR